MIPPISIDCLNDVLLNRLAAGDCTPDELSACEEHVSTCPKCCRLLDARAIDEVWKQQLLPAFLGTTDSRKAEYQTNTAHQAALNLLGPTDHPHMLGRIGSYEVVGLVGIGGMGVVFKAFDAALNRFVAIKMLQPHLSQSGAARQRFEREGRAAAAVICDFILPIYAVSEWQGHPFLVMQYSAGMNLQKRLELSGPLKLCEILRIGMQTARGLAAAHAQGLVHRDVKPSNILLDGSVERAMLTDFGLARAADDASVTRTGLIAGTPMYMSPEQVRGERVDQRSDLFSLGCTLYAMCTGYPPFRGDSSYAIIRRIVEDTPRGLREVNPDVPQWLEQVIMKLLAKSPNDRYESAEQVADLLEDCLAHVQQPEFSPLPKIGSQASASRPRVPGIVKFLAAASLLLLLWAGVIITLELNNGTLTIECDADDIPIRVMQGDQLVESMVVSRDGESTRIAAGKYIVELDQPFDQAFVADGVAVIERGGRQVVKVRRKETVEYVFQTHQVRDLLLSQPSDSVVEDLDSLEKLIRATINPDSWDDEQCSIHAYASNLTLVVRQTSEAQRAISTLLAQLQEQTTSSRSSEVGQKASMPDDQDDVASNPFQRLFDSIASASVQPAPNPIPVKIFNDCFKKTTSKSSADSLNDESTFLLESIQEVTRTEQTDGSVTYEFKVDGIMFIQEVGFLVNGDEAVANEILNGLLHDPNGPRIDLRKTLREHLGTRVKLTCDFQPDGTLDYVVEMGLIDPAVFLPTFRRFFTSEPRYMANESKDFYALSLPASNQAAKTEFEHWGTTDNQAEKTERWGAAVVGQQLYWGSLDKVEAMRKK